MAQESDKELITRVERMSGEFNVNAAEDAKVARMLQAVAQALRDAQNKNAELQREIDALKKAVDTKETFLDVVSSRIVAREHVKSLIDQGADINQKDSYGFTPLMRAGNVEVLSLLIEHGADLHAKNKFGQTALDVAKKAAQNLNPEYARFYGQFVRVLKQALAVEQQLKANDNQAPAKPETGSLMRAIIRRDTALAKSLIEQGADINEKARGSGDTPLMWAVMGMDTEIINALIQHGADIQAENITGKTALSIAKTYATFGRPYASIYSEIVKTLEQATAKQQLKVGETSALQDKPDVVIGGKPFTVWIKGKPLTVLIDGSGSMESTSAGQQAPLQRALDATLALADTGRNVSPVLWGDQKPVAVEATKEAFEKVSRGLRCGTDFSPAVEYMKASTESRNFVVLSDGELADQKQALAKTREVLSANPHITLDIVIIGDRKGVPMAELATALRKEYPRQVTLSTMKKNHDIAAVLTSIAALRGINQPKRLFPQKAGKPGL